LTSGVPKIFSAGLDLREFYKPKIENFQEFWEAFQDLTLTIYKSRLTSIAAINGAAPAGGCILSMACDYRIMVEGFVIGLNETQIGLVAPYWSILLMKNTVGNRVADLLIQTGELIPTKTALHYGLVDEFVLSNEELFEKCKIQMKKFSLIDQNAKYQSKLSVRKEFFEEFPKLKKEEIDAFPKFVTSKTFQQNIVLVLSKLQSKKSAKL
jgi:Delta3-Delta2-enoyl-CoA isomerase